MTNKRKQLHKLTEFLGIIMGIVLIYFSTLVQIPFVKLWLFLFGISTIIVDGYFLLTWMKK